MSNIPKTYKNCGVFNDFYCLARLCVSPKRNQKQCESDAEDWHRTKTGAKAIFEAIWTPFWGPLSPKISTKIEVEKRYPKPMQLRGKTGLGPEFPHKARSPRKAHQPYPDINRLDYPRALKRPLRIYGQGDPLSERSPLSDNSSQRNLLSDKYLARNALSERSLVKEFP